MNFLRRAAPLAILASGQIFVLVSGGFDLSVGSLVTLTVIGGSMLTANDPVEHLVGDRRALWDWPRRRAHQRRDRRLSASAVDHRDARHAAFGQRRRHDVVGRLAARLSARQFPHVRTLRVSRCAGHRRSSLSAIVVLARRLPRSPAGVCTGPCSAGGCSRSATMPRAAELAGRPRRFVRIGVFVISALQRGDGGNPARRLRRRLGRRRASGSSCKRSPPASSAACS